MVDPARKTLVELDTEATGHRIKNIMNEKQISVNEICDSMKVTFQAVYKWQRGETIPSITNLYLLAQILGVGVDEILMPRSEK